MKDLIKATGTLIDTIGTDQFAQTLSDALKGIVPFDYTVIFGYFGAARPMDLFDDFPRGKRKIFVEDYQEGPYLLDPFYLACGNHVESGLYRIRDLAPDRFFQGEYFRNYYARTGLAEEIGFFIEMPGEAIVVVSLMRAKKAFSAKEFRQIGEFCPIVRACCQRHWHDLSTQFGVNEDNATNSSIHQSVELAFTNVGGGVLTPREREVVEFTLKGHSADAVGRILEITAGTVRIHRRNVYSKLQIRSQGELFSKFIETLVSAEHR
ncbi:helix-turn-helix transcriptional regulator [Parasedimentitalea psychrophila]|uniref:Helix-turn-helix transcriptional regulator n=1 Tax=Parasedimentitalea psychrophila TaxID=2997337 RepID=A0A9Y2P1V6_9RHOB|nr:helix-turn-helix transcriptional regulator [Parasedimentitalea psychrophila]WIY24467.1 helix-turn-helix transcriptional regulator [Parasedimentitalea psychrophila]